MTLMSLRAFYCIKNGRDFYLEQEYKMQFLLLMIKILSKMNVLLEDFIKYLSILKFVEFKRIRVYRFYDIVL